MEESLGINKITPKPKELQRSRIKFDKDATRKCHNKLKELSPIYERCNALVSLSSGINATNEVKQDLLRAKQVRKNQAEDFIETRIKKNQIGFYDTIKKNKLKTFSSMECNKDCFSQRQECYY